MAFACLFDYVGAPTVNYGSPPDTTQRALLGSTVVAADPFWGGGTFIYGSATGTIAIGAVCTWDRNFAMTAVTNTAGLGRSVCVAFMAMTVGQFGWFWRSGLAPTAVTASVAAGVSAGITGAGTLGAVTAGKQILNAVSGAPSTQTVVKANVQTTNGSPVIVTQGYDGWFPGCTMTGTGISGTILSMSSDGRTVTLSANATATGSISATATYTGFILLELDCPFAQGQIL